jgi:hypothetical protein
MLNVRNNTRTTSLVFALVSLGLAGCSDSDPVGPGQLPQGEFDAQATAQALESLQANVDDDNDFLAALSLTGVAIQAEGGLSVATDYATAGVTGWADPSMVRSFVLSGGSAVPIFPANLLGKTFTWSEDLGRYALSEETGAPENGVRFIVYAENPITHTPAMPLNPVGYVDLTDESSAESTRLRIRAVSDGVTLIDYYIDAAFTMTSEEFAVQLHAVGFVSDGVKQLDFVLDQTAALDMATQALTMDVLYDLSIPAEDVGVMLALSGEFGEEGPVNAVATLTVTDGANTAVFSLNITDGEQVAGVLTYNGAPVVEISGTFDEAVFVRSDGEALTPDDIVALQEMMDIAGDVFEFATEILGSFEAGL